ncbi:GNAT family N-acetyltransferase [Erythrobacter aureus]|mgnify:FL=1|jgi:ribosomal-protein-alanine N-acetyltransferase|uniref:GNAT family N-acetyltransferase n=1 Tax=Erythrobacter aureus TaxID=2182384 RepID=UPI00267C8A2E|tara:strand:+ start:1096 stop:1548 length:453 start_codon:yes stop_codon:yes gene_type:complete
MSEIDQLMAVMDAAFEPFWREAWTRQQVANSLAMPHTYAILIDEYGNRPAIGGEAAGFVLARRAPGEEELLLIAVRPQMRGKGLGRKLIEMFATTARDAGAERIFLEMRANNPAEILYRSCGFEPIGKRRAYYRTLDSTTVDAITFARNL